MKKLIYIILALLVMPVAFVAAQNPKPMNITGEYDSDYGKMWLVLSDKVAFGYYDYEGAGGMLIGTPDSTDGSKWYFNYWESDASGYAEFQFFPDKHFEGTWKTLYEDVEAEGDGGEWNGKKVSDKLPPPPTKGALGGQWINDDGNKAPLFNVKQNGNFVFGTISDPTQKASPSMLFIMSNVNNEWNWVMYGPLDAILTPSEDSESKSVTGEASFDGKKLTLIPHLKDEEEETPLVLKRK